MGFSRSALVFALSLALSAVGCGGKEKVYDGDTGPSGEDPFGPGGGEYADPEGSCGTSGVSGSSGADCVSGVDPGGPDGPDGPDTPEEPEEPVCPLTHTFQYVGEAQTVWVTGAFSGWGATPAAGALELEQVSPGKWELEHTFAAAGTYPYKFIVDGTNWLADPQNPSTESDGVGGVNSVLHLCVVDLGPVDCALDEFSWQDPVMYFAMTDRFYDADGKASPVAGAADGDASSGPSAQYEGGDLAGVKAKMDYLADLGVTALWLSAPYNNREVAGAAINPAADPHQYSAYHGYWPSPADVSYADATAPVPVPAVESRIGTAQDLKAVVSAAHAANAVNGSGIKVLFDYVMKHVDTESGLYKAHPEWFYNEDGEFPLCGTKFENCDSRTRVGENDPGCLGWDHNYYSTRCAFTSYLAGFDFHDSEAALDWSVNDAMWWAKEYGIDGYRLDAIKHVPLTWLTALRSRLKAEIAEPAGGTFYLVGETFDYNNRDLLKRFVDPETMLDGQFDFPFKYRLCEALFKPAGSLESFSQWMAGNDGYYGPGAVMSTWIGNHDIPRAIHFASGQIGECWQGSDPGNAWTDDYSQPADAAPYERLALAFAVMMTNRGVPLIYYGDEVGLAGGGDPDDRRMMPWNDAALNDHQLALREKVKALARIRGENPILGRGQRRTIAATQDTWVYEMGGCEGVSAITVAINRADQERTVSLPKASYEDLVSGATQAGGSVVLSPRQFLILR